MKEDSTVVEVESHYEFGHFSMYPRIANLGPQLALRRVKGATEVLSFKSSFYLPQPDGNYGWL
jgi:hypothetical protein